MSKIDKLKSELSFVEKQYFASIAVIFTVCGWLFNNLDAPLWGQAAAVIAIVAAIIVAVSKSKQVKRILREIEDA